MTTLSITAANVALVSGNTGKDMIAGEAFIAGALLYQKAADGKLYKAQCDGSAEEAGANGLYMALATADAANARVSVAVPGDSVHVAASGMTIGVPYFVGATAGSFAPYADLVSTNKVTFAGMSTSGTTIKLGRFYDAGAVLV